MVAATLPLKKLPWVFIFWAKSNKATEVEESSKKPNLTVGLFQHFLHEIKEIISPLCKRFKTNLILLFDIFFAIV